MRSKSSTFRLGMALAVTGALGVFAAPSATAADRVCLYENFTATWCGYCPYVGRALTNLLADFPDDVSVLQVHVSDAYTCGPWGVARDNKYNVGGIPHILCDGVLEQVGAYTNDQSNYNVFNNWRNSRMGVPTDVVVDIAAVPVAGQTYSVTATVSLEADAPEPVTVDIHIVNTLFDYPHVADGRYNYTVRYGWNAATETLNPGDTVEVTQEVTFDTASWDLQDDIRLVAFAQIPGAGKTEILNSNFLDYPFGPDCPADLDGDGYIGQADLGLLLAAYLIDDGGDINGDGVTDQADLGALLSVYETDC